MNGFGNFANGNLANGAKPNALGFFSPQSTTQLRPTITATSATPLTTALGTITIVTSTQAPIVVPTSNIASVPTSVHSDAVPLTLVTSVMSGTAPGSTATVATTASVTESGSLDTTLVTEEVAVPTIETVSSPTTLLSTTTLDATNISATAQPKTISPQDTSSNNPPVAFFVILATLITLILAAIVCFACLCRRRRKRKAREKEKNEFEKRVIKSTELYMKDTKLVPGLEEMHEVADRRSAAELETRWSYYGRATELPARLSAREMDGHAVAAMKHFSYQPSIVVTITKSEMSPK